MLSTAHSQRQLYFPGEAYTIPPQSQGEYDLSHFHHQQADGASPTHSSHHSHSQSPSSSPTSAHPAAAGGVVPSFPPVSLPTLPSQQQQQQQPVYVPQLSMPAPPTGQPTPAFTLDPAFMLSEEALGPYLGYDCLLPAATGEDDRVYYMVTPSGSDTASPSLSSSPVSPGSASAESSGYSSDEAYEAFGDLQVPVSTITPPTLPNFAPMSRQPQPQQMYNLVPIQQQPQAQYGYYPMYAQQPQPQQFQPQMQMQMQMVPLQPGIQYQPAVYVPGMQYGYAPCVDPTALGSALPQQLPGMQQQQQSAEPTAPPKRDRRTARQRQPDYVPRPPNPFICFRQDWLRRLQRGEIDYHGPRDQRTMSFRISADWREMSEAAKAKFRREALIRKRQHAAKYPGYKFAPRQKEREPSLEEDGADA